MKICLVATYGVTCGIATYTAHLAQQLASEDEVVIFAEDYLNNKQPDFSSDLKVIRCFNRNHPSPGLLKALGDYPCDVVHIQHEYGIFGNLKNELRQVAAEYKGRTVMTLHTVCPPSGVFDLHNCADCFIVHNRYGEEYLLRQGIKRNKIKVITHGTLLFPKISQKEARAKLRLPLERKIILTHSFIERRKNIDKVIKAVAKLKNDLPISYIHVGGVHPHVPGWLGQAYLNECRELIRELDIALEAVIVDRFISEEEMSYYLAAADILVVMEDSTYPEMHASGVMHTVTPGKPVIASDIPDFAEFPDDAVYKINIDEESLEQAIKEVLSDPGLASRLSGNLLSYAQATSWENMAKRHVEVYEDIMNSYRLAYLSKSSVIL